MMVKENYGFEGISFDNIEQLFNPKFTKIGSIQETVDYLVQRGMSYSLAKKLLQQYLNKIEASSNIYDLIDLFTDSRAKAAINNAGPDDVILNYNSAYIDNKVVNWDRNYLKERPIRPVGT